MKAIVCTKYGPPDVLRFIEVEKPAPDENQILIDVHAASINALEWHLMRADPFFIRLTDGLLKPRNPRFGRDVAGRVEAVGENVKQFHPGDEVFGCAHGSFGEFAIAEKSELTLKPSNISYENAAAVPVAALTALQGIRYAGGIGPEQKVLIQGASGGVGTFAVQFAKLFGAKVTAVCSTRNQDMARSIGADKVIDYTKEDFTRNSERYDLIVGVNGYHPISAYKRALKPEGIYVCTGGTMRQIFESMLLGSLMSRKEGKKLANMGIATINEDDLDHVGDLLKAEKIVPVIDRSYPLNEVAEAMRYVEDIHAQGKVVITVT